jgi:DNA-binding NarL/FixJ family response regulator
MKPTRVLLVTHQPIIGAGLRLLLDEVPSLTVVGQAEEADAALKLAAQLSPDLLLLLPFHEEEATFSLISGLAALALDTRIVVLTSKNVGITYCSRLITLGAVGIVYTEQTTETLTRALKRVAEGEVWLERSLMATVLTDMSRSATITPTGADGRPIHGAVAQAKATDRLTPREKELIHLIGEGLKNKQIAERLFITELTVRNHLASIYSKLGVANRLALAIYAHNNGLLEKLPN